MTHEEIEKKAQEAAWTWAVENKLDPYSMGRAFGEGYVKALEETESLQKVKGYIARDKDGGLAFWSVKPMRCTLDRDTCRWFVPGACYYLNLAYTNMFPEITWESEPVEVEFLIRVV